PENLSVPDGIRLVFQPAHSPELQPAEHLWAFVDEPLANCCFATIESLEQAVSDRCVRPRPAAKHDPRQHALPLVAMSASKEVISRSWYQRSKWHCRQEKRTLTIITFA
ncbi:MAG: hypothetical protein WA441_02415, partial [Methyloceanibacter sp.]